jgi:hypothetical protein
MPRQTSPSSDPFDLDPDALAKQDETFSEQRDHLIALAGPEVRRVLEEQHTKHMAWFWTTAADEMTEALLHRDVVGFMHSGVNSANGLGLVCDTWPLLQGLGMYEACLLDGFTGQKHNFHHWEEEILHLLVELADRDLLRQAGPLPTTLPPVLYRGVSGPLETQHIRSLFWTASLKTAWWFARRYEFLEDPTVYAVVPQESMILAYTNERQEEEYLLELPQDYPVERVADE